MRRKYDTLDEAFEARDAAETVDEYNEICATICEDNLWLVDRQVNGHRLRTDDQYMQEEYRQTAAEYLMRAIHSYDRSTGIPFTAWANISLRKSLVVTVSNIHYGVRLSHVDVYDTSNVPVMYGVEVPGESVIYPVDEYDEVERRIMWEQFIDDVSIYNERVRAGVDVVSSDTLAPYKELAEQFGVTNQASAWYTKNAIIRILSDGGLYDKYRDLFTAIPYDTIREVFDKHSSTHSVHNYEDTT